MSSQDLSERLAHYSKLTAERLQQIARDALDLVFEFKALIVVVVVWIIIAEFAGYSAFNLIRALFRLIIYPFNLIVFGMEFTEANVPQIFIIFMPLVFLMLIGFLIIVSTED